MILMCGMIKNHCLALWFSSGKNKQTRLTWAAGYYWLPGRGVWACDINKDRPSRWFGEVPLWNKVLAEPLKQDGSLYPPDTHLSRITQGFSGCPHLVTISNHKEQCREKHLRAKSTFFFSVWTNCLGDFGGIPFLRLHFPLNVKECYQITR